MDIPGTGTRGRAKRGGWQGVGVGIVLSLVAVMAVAADIAPAGLPDAGVIDALRAMGGRLAGLNAFAFTARIDTVHGKPSGSVRDTATCRVVFQRPDRLFLRYEVPGEALTLVLNGSRGMMALDSARTYRRITRGDRPEDFAGWLTQQPAIRRVLSPDPFAGWLDHVRQASRADEPLSTGPATRFNLRFDRTDVALWVGVESGLPERLDADLSRGAGRPPGTETVTITWTAWNVAPVVDDGVFNPVPPEGYRETRVFAAPDDAGTTGPVGMEMPPVTLDLCTGDSIDFGSCRGERVLVLDFWATWCRPCRYAVEQVQRLAGQFQDTGAVTFVTVNLMETPEVIRPWKQNQKLTLPVALDRDGQLAEQLRVEALPTTVVVGRDGVIRYMKTGYARGAEQELKAIIADLVAGKEPDAPKRFPTPAEQLRWRMDLDRDAYCSVFVRY
ncbi:MAG TPA: redoxin domain-containing protein [Candidatus Hydrogenedentes bacterium]|nr:redoxin domain-containing protein [Candidatus Hydrogenedentota bacterium]